jgi:hypothetical protein
MSVYGAPSWPITSGGTPMATTARARSAGATPSSRSATHPPAATAAKRTGEKIDTTTQLREIARHHATSSSLVRG